MVSDPLLTMWGEATMGRVGVAATALHGETHEQGSGSVVGIGGTSEVLQYLSDRYLRDAGRVDATARAICASMPVDARLEPEELVHEALLTLAERAGDGGLVVRGSPYGLLNARMRHAAVDHRRWVTRHGSVTAPAYASPAGNADQDAGWDLVDVGLVFAQVVADVREVVAGVVVSATVHHDRDRRLTATSWAALQCVAVPRGMRRPLDAGQRQALRRARRSLGDVVPRAVAVVRRYGLVLDVAGSPCTERLVHVLEVAGLLGMELTEIVARWPLRRSEVWAGGGAGAPSKHPDGDDEQVRATVGGSSSRAGIGPAKLSSRSCRRSRSTVAW